MDAKLHRRWFRFSLRTLLVFVTIASAGFGWLGVKVRAKQKEREAVKALRARRDYVAYDYEVDAMRVPVTSATPPGPRWLRKVLGDDYFADVVLVQYFANDTEDCPESRLNHLGAFPRLKALDLSGTYFDDGALTHLQGLAQLEWLKLSNAGYSDAALIPLRDLPQLRELIVGRTSITDAGLIHLRGLNHLKLLKISLNRITDAGLTHLRGLSELKELDVGATQVTNEGCQELQKALPQLKIVRW